jgi:RNA-directed DNA polymerase
VGCRKGHHGMASFDNIDQERLLAKLPVFTATIRRWLKAGVVELGHYSPTDTGTPQGGVITPPTMLQIRP